MKTVVCIKQVPDSKTVRFDEEKGTLIREGVQGVINPYDLHAIEAAVSLKEQTGGEVTVLSMGPPQAESSLREAISRGADSAVLLCDRAFAGADTLATTYTLACALAKIGGFDLVICGKQTSDGDTAQVGPGLAARLQVSCVTSVSAIHGMDGGLQVSRVLEDGEYALSVKLPAVITVLTSLNTPRLPSLKGKMRAKKAAIPVWTAADIDAEPGRVGFAGSPTEVCNTWVPVYKAKREMLEGTPVEQAEMLTLRLRDAGVI